MLEHTLIMFICIFVIKCQQTDYKNGILYTYISTHNYLKQTLPEVRVGTIHHLLGIAKKTCNPNCCYFAFHTA